MSCELYVRDAWAPRVINEKNESWTYRLIRPPRRIISPDPWDISPIVFTTIISNKKNRVVKIVKSRAIKKIPRNVRTTLAIKMLTDRNAKFHGIFLFVFTPSHRSNYNKIDVTTMYLQQAPGLRRFWSRNPSCFCPLFSALKVPMVAKVLWSRSERYLVCFAIKIINKIVRALSPLHGLRPFHPTIL